MATGRRHEEKPWQPKVGREREFNPFVNALDRSAGLEHLPPLERSETGEDASIEYDRVAGKSACTKASVARAELADWLIAENEIERVLVSEQAVGRGGHAR